MYIITSPLKIQQNDRGFVELWNSAEGAALVDFPELLPFNQHSRRRSARRSGRNTPGGAKRHNKRPKGPRQAPRGGGAERGSKRAGGDPGPAQGGKAARRETEQRRQRSGTGRGTQAQSTARRRKTAGREGPGGEREPPRSGRGPRRTPGATGSSATSDQRECAWASAARHRSQRDQREQGRRRRPAPAEGARAHTFSPGGQRRPRCPQRGERGRRPPDAQAERRLDAPAGRKARL